MPSGTVLITGAATRIGRALALTLADAGYDIAVHYLASKQQADDLVELIRKKGCKASSLQADLSQEDQTAALVKSACDALGPLSMLINNASVFEHDDLKTMTRSSWDQHIEINLRAPLKLSQDFAAQAVPGMNPLILNIIDQRVLKLTPQFLSYTSSKSALFTLTKTLAQALGPQGLRVNAIGPGPTLKNPRQSDADWEQQNSSTILGYGATPEDICDAALYLATARAVTGQMIVVDGGQHLSWKTPDVMGTE